MAKKQNKISLTKIINENGIFNDKDTLSNVYIKIERSERNMENAYYMAKIYTHDGKPLEPFTVEHDYANKSRTPLSRKINEIGFSKNGLVELMKFIQNGEIGRFSSIKMFAQERSVTYQGSDTHYYLDLLLGAPGKKVKLKKKQGLVKACAKCDNMLLRFSYDWKMQKDDLKEKECPYCSEPLKIIERERKYIEIFLDIKAEKCKITGTNNQIGVIYNGIPIKATVKVVALRNFLQHFQNLFTNNVIGPFDVKFSIARSHRNLVSNITYIDISGELEWRPAVLYPEDLIAF